MRILLVSEYGSRLDEGMRNIAFQLDRHLSRRHQVEHLSLSHRRRVLLPSVWRDVRASRPDIIHLVPGHTLKGLLLVKALQRLTPGAKAVVSVHMPVLSRLGWRLLPFLRPDLVLLQSRRTQQRFVVAGCATHLVPSGVDAQAFLPVTPEVKTQLRLRYGVPERAFVALHVGPLRVGRNLLSLTALQQEGVQVLVVGSLSTPAETEELAPLEESGCLVWHRYLPSMPEVYALADCYVFPTRDESKCIQMPLSVMEAMACNLPVVSTPFGALPEHFPAGDGLLYFEDDAELPGLVRQLRDGEPAATRVKVLAYPWEAVAEKTEEAYRMALEGT